VIPETDDTGELVYEQGQKFWRTKYTITTGKNRTVTLEMSKARQVVPRMTFDNYGGTMVEGERKELGEAIEFCEALDPVKPSKTGYTIKIIQAGQGASAFYPEDVLKRDGPKVFRTGIHMHWNHATRAEETARPEGDLNTLAGVLTSNAYWDQAGPKGPGLYASCKVFSDFAEAVADRAPHIGISIRAFGNGTTDKEGVFRLKQLTAAQSVDFVTHPGAGGRIVLTESAQQPTQEVTTMTPEEKAAIEKLARETAQATVTTAVTEAVTPLNTKITALETENSGLRRTAAIAEARVYIAGKVKGEALPDPAKLRVVDAVLATEVPMKEGKLDTAALDESIKAAVKAEALYVSSITEGGRVRGMGASAPAGGDGEVSDKDFRERMKQYALSQGMTEAEATTYAAGRN
jgi:2-hydroxychromene-2-carboxylate isomerase